MAVEEPIGAVTAIERFDDAGLISHMEVITLARTLRQVLDGWPNRETRSFVTLTLDRDAMWADMMRHLRDTVRAQSASSPSGVLTDAQRLEIELRDWAEGMWNPTGHALMGETPWDAWVVRFYPLVKEVGSLWRVDFHHIARHLLEDE